MVNNDDELRKKTAEQWKKMYGADIKPEDINCVGCRVQEGVHGGYCGECPIRKCALEKGEENCYVCKEFENCDKRKEFEKVGIDIAKNFQ